MVLRTNCTVTYVRNSDGDNTVKAMRVKLLASHYGICQILLCKRWLKKFYRKDTFNANYAESEIICIHYARS